MRHRILNIAIAVDFSLASGRNFFAGILRYVRLKGSWRVRVLQSRGEFDAAAVRRLEAEGTDGIISTLLYDEDVRKLLDASRIPLVVITSPNNRLKNRTQSLTYLNVDEEQIGRDAAAYFDRLGKFMTYASVRHTPSPYGAPTHGRRHGFRTSVRAAGHPFTSFEGDPSDIAALGAWLKDLPKPAAIFAGRDTCAQKILAACAKARLAVPQQVSVLGVDNDELICLSCTPPLTSLLPGAEDEGYAAAAELERLLNGRRHDIPQNVVCPTRNEIVERRSTAPVKPATDLILRALAYIEEHVERPPSIADIVSHLRVSRRLAEIRFRELLNESIGEAILRLRLEHLAKRLRTEDTKLKDLCHSSGFANVSYAMTAFRRQFGQTMSEFRLMRPDTNRSEAVSIALRKHLVYV